MGGGREDDEEWSRAWQDADGLNAKLKQKEE